MTTEPSPMADAELALIRTADAMDRVTEAGRRSPAVQDRGRLLAEVDRLRAELAETRRVADHNNAAFVKALNESAAENTALAAKLAAVFDVITPKNPDWKPLSERHPEFFKPDTPEEAARKKGWKQGVDLLTQQIRAALGETGGTDAR